MSVVVFDKFHATGKPPGLGLLACVGDLLVRNVESLHLHPIVLRHVHGERSPATTCFDNPHPGFQLYLAAHMVHFRHLRLFQAGFPVGVVGTGVNHLFIQP